MTRQVLITIYHKLYMYAKINSIEHFAYGYVHALLSGSRELTWVHKQLMRACKANSEIEHNKKSYEEYQTNSASVTAKMSIYEQALERLALLMEPTDSISHNLADQSADDGEHFKVLMLVG